MIAATDDPSTPPEHGERIAAAVRCARLEVVPGAAHLANVERPDALNRLLVDSSRRTEHDEQLLAYRYSGGGASCGLAGRVVGNLTRSRYISSVMSALG